jgi:hypothetical protein
MNPTPPALAVMHGIPNCDTVKKARTWLLAQRVAYSFHDFKKAGVPEDLPLWEETYRAAFPGFQAAHFGHSRR